MKQLDEFISNRSGSTGLKNAASSITRGVLLTAFMLALFSCSQDDTFYYKAGKRTVRTLNRMHSQDYTMHREGNIIGYYYGYYDENIIFGIFIETEDNKKLACFNLSRNDIFDEPFNGVFGSFYSKIIPVTFEYRYPSEDEFIDLDKLEHYVWPDIYLTLSIEMKEYKQVYITQLIK